jgi:hypothetical protein
VAHFELQKVKTSISANVPQKADIHNFCYGVETAVFEANVSLPCEPIQFQKKIVSSNEKLSHTEVMQQRWAAAQRFLPNIDK